jgi:hypothetical protein
MPSSRTRRDRVIVPIPRKLLREPEIGQNDMSIPTYQDVFGFEVAVDDAGCV